jgi:HEAT repeat protein
MSEGLKNPDRHERARVVRALGDSQDHAGAVRALEAVLRHDPDRGVRFSAAVALGQLGGPDATALLVEKAASTDESDVRGAALDAIETSRDPSAIPGLINLFRLNRGQDDVVAQLGASRALLKIGAPAVPQLLQALNDSSAKVREAVVRVLGETGNPEVADRIAALHADPDFGVRWEVERALAKLKGKPAPTTP